MAVQITQITKQIGEPGFEQELVQALKDMAQYSEGTFLLVAADNTTYTKDEIDTLLEGYYTKTEIDTLLESYYTKTEIDTNIGSVADFEGALV